MQGQLEGHDEFAVLSGVASTAIIDTEDGRIPLDWIACGDRVLTRDAGYQTVRWVARTVLDVATLQKYPEVAPVIVHADTFGDHGPEVDLVTSPSQLFPCARADGTEVLISADVVGEPVYPSLRRRDERFVYMNVLLDTHALIRVDGVWVGSVYTGDLEGDGDADGPMTPVAPILERTAALGLWRVQCLGRPMRRA